MSKIANLDFSALKSNGDNYLEWALDAKIMLRSKDLGDTITEDNNSSDKDKNRAIYMMRHHFQENLKTQYMTMENPYDLWIALQRRYDHQKTVLLPKAQYDWKHIRFLDYKSVDEYNSVLFRIVSLLRLCGEKVTEEEMLNKTLSTFPQTNMVLQQQYKERNFATYTELIECLLLAEANNELLLKNSEMRPPGTAPLPDISKLAIEPKKESNLVQHNDHPGPNRGRSQGRGRVLLKHTGEDVVAVPHPALAVVVAEAVVCLLNHRSKLIDATDVHLCELYMESLKRNPEANMVRDPGYDDDDDDDDLEDVQDHQHESDKVDHMGFETSDIMK
ncbi:uncharacterized protein LOC125603866 [Brassica napus]|uniref:uncharacterized protein LOC125603866 n=1 Tax=Brassica napus TaxID=3708 RepID=UPI0020786A6F|nr:uncharacterized protein LOC125603866 [Brassica napus]